MSRIDWNSRTVLYGIGNPSPLSGLLYQSWKQPRRLHFPPGFHYHLGTNHIKVWWDELPLRRMQCFGSQDTRDCYRHPRCMVLAPWLTQPSGAGSDVQYYSVSYVTLRSPISEFFTAERVDAARLGIECAIGNSWEALCLVLR